MWICMQPRNADALSSMPPTANTVAVAEHGIALMAAMARNIAQADTSVKAAFYEDVIQTNA
ncbi:hypothetical protein EJ110_NYTH11347 [Nymphaea thermarum]|nr:hypothetical protein EJ110_NYTH11347 [Nymphaea thermarum]